MTKVDSMTVFNTEEVETTKQPMFFGEELNTQRYDDFKYPIFDKLIGYAIKYYNDIIKLNKKGALNKTPFLFQLNVI